MSVCWSKQVEKESKSGGVERDAFTARTNAQSTAGSSREASKSGSRARALTTAQTLPLRFACETRRHEHSTEARQNGKAIPRKSATLHSTQHKTSNRTVHPLLSLTHTPPPSHAHDTAHTSPVPSTAYTLHPNPPAQHSPPHASSSTPHKKPSHKHYTYPH